VLVQAGGHAQSHGRPSRSDRTLKHVRIVITSRFANEEKRQKKKGKNFENEKKEKSRKRKRLGREGVHVANM